MPVSGNVLLVDCQEFLSVQRRAETRVLRQRLGQCFSSGNRADRKHRLSPGGLQSLTHVSERTPETRERRFHVNFRVRAQFERANLCAVQ